MGTQIETAKAFTPYVLAATGMMMEVSLFIRVRKWSLNYQNLI